MTFEKGENDSHHAEREAADIEVEEWDSGLLQDRAKIQLPCSLSIGL